MHEQSMSVGYRERAASLTMSYRDGTLVAARRRSLMVHDLVLSVVFLSMVIAPALIAMRADNGEQDF